MKKVLVLLLTLLSLLVFSYYCYGEQSQTLDFTPPTSVFDKLNTNLDSLEQNWNLLLIENQNLESKANDLESKANDLEKQLETLETLQNEQIQYSANLEILLQKSDKKYRFWRNTAIVSISISIPTITTLLIIASHN